MNSYLFGLLFISGFILNIQAMENSSEKPTIDFKNKSRQELNGVAITANVLALTPRSKKSLEERVIELGITIDTGDFIYTALSADGSRPARPGDIVKFVTTKSYYAQYKQMPPDNYRPQLMLRASTRERVDQLLSGLFGPNGFGCAYPDLPVIQEYGPCSCEPAVACENEDYGLNALFQDSCSLK
jgi:hypothetical protein